MRAVHVVPSIANLGSGLSWSVPYLCEELARHGVEVRLDVLEADGRSVQDVEIRAHGRVDVFGSFGVSPSLRRSVLEALQQADVVHNHSLWMAPNMYPGIVPEEKRTAKLVVAPRGTLAPWAWRWKWWKKRPLWYLGQRRVLEQADGFHATARSEVDHIRERGFTQPAAVIPNGVHVPSSIGFSKASPKEVLFLSRVHPKKGLPMLVRAWARVASGRHDWCLRIVGPDQDGHAAQISELVANLNLENVSIEGPKFDAEKRTTYERASLSVLPTHSENFGIVVAEALAHGVPVLTTTGTPWEDLETRQCGWWVHPNIEEIASGLEQALSLSDEARHAMGRRGRQWMEDKFSWSTQAEKMSVFYQWLIRGGEVPRFVVT